METIKEILMRRDGLSALEAGELIVEAKKDLQQRLEDEDQYDDPHEICSDWFGLEPDYIMELL